MKAIEFRKLLTAYGVPCALLVIIFVFSFLRPDSFPTWRNLNAILMLASPLLLSALGVTIVLAQGDFDISFANTIGLVAAITFLLIAEDRANLPWGIAVCLAMLVGVFIGLANGVLVALCGLSSLVATLATGTVMIGIEYLLTDQQTVYGKLSSSFMEIGQGALVFGLNNQIWVAGLFAAGMWVLAEHTEIGRYFYATGSSREAARLSGINVRRVRIYGFMLLGFMAGLSGILITAQTASNSPDTGLPYLLPSFTAAFLGTAMFKQGYFNIFGTIVGVILLGVIQTGLIMLQLSTAWINLIQGGVLILAVLLSRFGVK